MGLILDQSTFQSPLTGAAFRRDHDDDVSVAEACKKLNEVSGLKGMGRYS